MRVEAIGKTATMGKSQGMCSWESNHVELCKVFSGEYGVQLGEVKWRVRDIFRNVTTAQFYIEWWSTSLISDNKHNKKYRFLLENPIACNEIYYLAEPFCLWNSHQNYSIPGGNSQYVCTWDNNRACNLHRLLCNSFSVKTKWRKREILGSELLCFFLIDHYWGN